MDSPRAGYHRAAASWAVVGVAVVAVGGASALAYADTVKEQSTGAAADSAVSSPGVDQGSAPAPSAVPDVAGPGSVVDQNAPPATSTPQLPDAPGPSPAVDQGSSPAPSWAPVPDSIEPSTAPVVTTTAPAPVVTGPTSTVQRPSPLSPTTSMAPNYSPGLLPGSGSIHTRSRGS
jgi:hypothetical protein